MHLDPHTFLNRYIFKRSVIEPWGVLNLNDKFDQSIYDQLVKLNETLPLCQIECVEPSVVHVWHLDDYKSHYNAYVKRKTAEDIARKERLIEHSIIQLLIPIIKSKIPALDDKALNILAEQFTKERHTDKFKMMFEVYGVNMNELEKKAKE